MSGRTGDDIGPAPAMKESRAVKLIRVDILGMVIGLLLASLLLAGCPNKQAPTPAGTGENAGAKSAPVESQQGSTASPEQRQDLSRLAGRIDGETAAASGSTPVTREQVEGLTGYGAIMFPDSSLVADKSFVQKLPDGTEIYRLEFGVSAAADAIVQWYKDNLEPGTQQSAGTLGDGSTFAVFNYVSADKSVMKTVTVKGYPSQVAGTILVNLTVKGKPAEDDAANGSGR